MTTDPNEAAPMEPFLCIQVPCALPLRTIEVPREVTAVDGCDCGGCQWHAEGCSIWGIPREDAMAAIADAEARSRAFTDALNAQLVTAGLRRPT
jgi:hypothetical protein